MKNNQENIAHTAKELLIELQALAAEAGKMAGDSVSEHTEEAMTALHARFAQAQERLGTLYQSGRKRVIAGAHRTDESIRANPYQSIVIAAGVGLLVGVLLGRRKD